MPKVTVTVPASCINLGPGIESLGLALGLYNTVEINLRPDQKPTITILGESPDAYPTTSSHPVMKAISAFSQAQNVTPTGISVVCTSRIPFNCGLGDHAAWVVGGLAAINNLLGSPRDGTQMSRDHLINAAAQLTDRPAAAITSLLGGLTITASSDDELLYRQLSVRSLELILALPDIPDYRQRLAKAKASTKKVDLKDVIFNVGHTALLVEALRNNDMALLAKAMQDRVLDPNRKTLVPGFDNAISAARQAGAAATVFCGDGPALISFAAHNHSRIEGALCDAFRVEGINVRTWIIKGDSQGITINLQQ